MSQGPTRRDLLAAALAMTAAPSAATTRAVDKEAADTTPPGGFIARSQPLPVVDVRLPTDRLPPPDRDGPPRRIAALATAYFRYSHADDIITKFIEGYSVVGRTHPPHCKVVSLHLDQSPETDLGRPLAARYGIPVFGSPTDALTLGKGKGHLEVDGVLLIGEHGEYPFNTKEQHLYPRRRLFKEVLDVFRASGRSAPIYTDKHLSYDWSFARGMYDEAKSLGVAMMAGSSVPVAWRRPALALRPGAPIEQALALGFSGTEVYGFHALELLQAFTEKRKGGESGVVAARCLEGQAAWEAAARGLWSTRLLRDALRTIPGGAQAEAQLATDADLRRADPNAVVLLMEYRDGLHAAAYLSRGLANEFAIALKVQGVAEPVATWCELNKPQRDHFSFLCNHIEVMFRTGKASYPVERTLLVTGALAALMDSRAQGGIPIPTPHLAELAYAPVPDFGTTDA